MLTVKASNSQPQKRFLAILGIMIFLAGIAIGLYLNLLLLEAQVNAVFAGIESHARQPARHLTLNCPGYIARHEVVTVTARISNFSTRSVAYTLNVKTLSAGYRADDYAIILSGPKSGSRIILTSGETTDLAWDIAANKDTPHLENIALRIDAVADRDLLQDKIDPRSYPWPPHGEYSYRGYCGLVLIDWFGLSGIQVRMLTGLTMLLGGVLWLYGGLPFGNRGILGYITGAIIGISVFACQFFPKLF